MACPLTNIEKLHILETRIENMHYTWPRRRKFIGRRRDILVHHSWSPPHIDLSISNRNITPKAAKNGTSRTTVSILSTNSASLLTKGVEKAVRGQQQDVDAALAQFLDQLKNNKRPPAQSCDALISRKSLLLQESTSMSYFWCMSDKKTSKIAVLYSKKRHTDVRKLYKLVYRLEYQLKYNTYQAVLRSLLAINDVDAAVNVFRDLQNRGMAPNKVTYCCLISALGKQRRRGSRYAHVAYELWQELRTASSLPLMSDLDPVALRTGMKACVDVGKIDEAQDLLECSIAQTGKADVRAYNIIIKGHASNKDIPALEAVVEDMKTAGVKPSSVTFNILIDAHARAGMLEKAREQMMEAAATKDVALDAWSYTSLIKACVEKDDMDGALAIRQEMQNAGIAATCITYSTLIDGFVRRGDVSRARSLLDEMIASGAEPSAVTYNSLLRGCMESSSEAESDDSWSAQKRAGKSFSPTSSSSSSLPPYRNDNTSNTNGMSLLDGVELLDDMRGRGILPAVDTFNTLMSAAVSSDDSYLALGLYERMLEAGLRPDGVTYTVLMMAYGRVGRVADAVGAFESLSRDPNAAMDVAAYNAMVDAFARTGEMAAAEKMVDSACKFAKKCRQPPPVEAYGALVAGYARLQHVELAVRAVRRFHAAGGTPDEQMLDQLAELGVRTGEFKVAMQAVRALELMGRSIDKEKYKEMVLRKMKARSSASGGNVEKEEGDDSVEMITAMRGGDGRGASKRRGNSKANAAQGSSVNVYLERFKFWLGLPNSYYDACDDA